MSVSSLLGHIHPFCHNHFLVYVNILPLLNSSSWKTGILTLCSATSSVILFIFYLIFTSWLHLPFWWPARSFLEKVIQTDLWRQGQGTSTHVAVCVWPISGQLWKRWCDWLLYPKHICYLHSDSWTEAVELVLHTNYWQFIYCKN